MDASQLTIEKVQGTIEYFSRLDLFKEAYLYNEDLKKWLKENNLEKTDPGLYKKYASASSIMDFISLNRLEDWEKIYELLKNHFEESAKIEGYNLWEKIRTRLSYEYTMEQRDEIKKKLKKILEINNRDILIRDKYKNIPGMPIKVSEWIKDFTANLGVGKFENIKKANYLTRGPFITKLRAEDKEKIEKLLLLYENVSLPSTTPEGFEDEVPIILEDGKIGVFSKGNIEEIDHKLLDAIRSVKLPRKGLDNDNTDIEKKQEELKKLALNYPAGSLERKAIEEEIKKSEGGELESGKKSR